MLKRLPWAPRAVRVARVQGQPHVVSVSIFSLPVAARSRCAHRKKVFDFEKQPLTTSYRINAWLPFCSTSIELDLLCVTPDNSNLLPVGIVFVFELKCTHGNSNPVPCPNLHIPLKSSSSLTIAAGQSLCQLHFADWHQSTICMCSYEDLKIQ